MKLFITYASEDRSVADELAVRLRTEGHTVFLDKDGLPEAEGYDARIRQAIAECDLYVFLISPDSVKAGRYTLTEMKFAREQFLNPKGRVLPVMIQLTPFGDIPAYLSAVTVLQPEGNAVAETVAQIGNIEGGHERVRLLRLAGLAVVLVIVVSGVGWWWGHSDHPSPPCRLMIEPAGGSSMSGLALDVTTEAETSAYMLSGGSVSLNLKAVTRKGEPWSLLLRKRDGSALGQKDLSGCPQTRIRVNFGDVYAMDLVPQ